MADLVLDSGAAPRRHTGVRALLAARLALISFFMGLVVFYQYRYGQQSKMLPAMLAPIAATYLLSIAYLIYLKLAGSTALFAYLQLTLDLLLVSWVVYATGGVNSPLSFNYVLVIVAASYFQARRASFWYAGAAALLYGGLLSLEYFRLINPYDAFPPITDARNLYFFFTSWFVNVTIFFLVATISNYFSGVISETGQELRRKSEDFTMLKAFHENVLKSMDLGFLAIGLDGVILSHNPAAERILVLPPVRIDGHPARDTLDLPKITEAIAGMAGTGETSRLFTWSYPAPYGRELNLTLSLTKFATGGRTHGFIAVFHDVSELKEMERQVANAERMAAIGRVAAGVAHEIRNPLASISGSMQMLESDLAGLLNEQNQRLMNIMARETSRLNRIITQFLGFAAPAKINAESADLRELIEETVALLESDTNRNRGVRFESRFEGDTTAWVDTGQIRQVLWNLCVNALDAMPHGGVLRVGAARVSMPGRADGAMAVRLSFEDSGEGISLEARAHLFEPFFTTKPFGTGLGLPTVQKIVEAHGGKVTVTSRHDKGSTFTVWLPVDGAFSASSPYLHN
ncbi:MAG: PAS domain S-box protein [Nitrospinae bacterium]|nr:PAS domain S-box protein [Nitrospinota bacterium]